MRELEGRTALVTGAASGIGLGMARTLRARGHVGGAVRYPGDRLDAALAEVRGLGEAIAVRPTCRTAPRCARRAKRRPAFGAVHVACNNAGVTIHGRSVAELTPQEWEWNVGVNFFGVVHGLEVFLPLIRARRRGTHRQYGLDRGLPDRRAPAQRLLRRDEVRRGGAVGIDRLRPEGLADRRVGAGARGREDAHL